MLSNPSKRAEYDLTLPPEIAGWDSSSPANEAQSELITKAHTTRDSGKPLSGAYGVFGKTMKESDVDESLERQLDEQTMHLRHAVRPSLFKRILRMFGL